MFIHRSLPHLVCAGFVLGTVSMLSPLSAAVAQPFPSNMIRIVVAAGPGTPPDIISRIVATELQQSEGWRVVVENKVGAMQTIAGAEVLKQPADGHTIVSVSLPGMTAPTLLPNMNIQLERDFTPVVKLSTSYNVLVVHPSVQAKSMAELVALLKSQPDKLTFSSGGFGTPAHLAGELFKVRTGVRATHVPYQQLPQAIGDLLAGTNSIHVRDDASGSQFDCGGKTAGVGGDGSEPDFGLAGGAHCGRGGILAARGAGLGGLSDEEWNAGNNRQPGQ